MYKYDLHVHTKEGSACGRSTGAEMAEMYAREGYSGFVVTEHFYTGNTAVPRDLPWEEWVGAGIAVVLAGLGVYLLANKETRAFSKRAYQIVMADLLPAKAEH